jgi:hypothetical protein
LDPVRWRAIDRKRESPKLRDFRYLTTYLSAQHGSRACGKELVNFGKPANMKQAKGTVRLVVPTAILFAFAAILFLPSCGLGDGMKCIGATPVPKLSSVAPTTVNSGTLPASIILSGSGFVSWSTVYLNSANLASVTLSSNRISATIDSQALSAAGVNTGTVNISVTNAGQIMGGILGCPNGGDSKIIPITIE